MENEMEVTKETIRGWLNRDVRAAMATLGIILSSEAYMDMLAEKLHDDYVRVKTQESEGSRNGS